MNKNLIYCAAIFLLASLARGAESSFSSADQAALNRGYALEVETSKTVRCRMSAVRTLPNRQVEEWVVVAAAPPSHTGQKILSAKLTPVGESITPPHARHNTLFRSVVKVENSQDPRAHRLEAEIVSEVELFRRKLVHREAGKTYHVPTPLSASERAAFFSREVPFLSGDPDFLRWREAHDLIRKPQESEVDFARRAFVTIARNFKYTYSYEMNRLVGNVCREGKTDCGGLGVLFITLLRSQGIPARMIVGRWAQSAEKGDELEGLEYHQQHAKAEFYAEGVGWVPVDCSSAVERDTSPERTRYFGNDHGDFLTMHYDSHLEIDSLVAGTKIREDLQAICIWNKGTGRARGGEYDFHWVVEPLAKP